MACVMDNGSCANGQACCTGLMCCSGPPVQPGQEFCGAMCPISDRALKQNFAPIDPADVLDKVCALPISTWNYKAEDPAVRHLGPMAQDFKASFKLGSTDKSIFTVDADGVALAAIQALEAELRAVRKQNAALRRSLRKMDARLGALEDRSR